MKCLTLCMCCRGQMSLPVRGAWIEIAETQPGGLILRSLPVRGAWIEIARQTAFGGTACGRSPCGERGLKFFAQIQKAFRDKSLPVRGAWIEIL